ncbi:TetR/AcrR family transcriptional regulator [Micromonospora sp. ATA51]|uniref:TetR/AcrR family transcriptional regulator n=1 Tax=Micromonospora sp. ATA51 TaxID=2806098 RepID=UPI001A4A778B|nr:TetR/AcrR family transcriptional regulator [Micromonospora sp. ATA51]MBM0225763.1 TetR/AcrR family transcriptional regulator [Micromonospora sp. ATA51]
MTDTTDRRRRAPGMTPDRRRAMIVQAALPLLATHGATLTTAQVARAAGIGEATVFRAFADKEALLDACVVEVLRPDTVLDELAAIPLTQPLGDRLSDAASALLAHFDRLGAVLGALHAAGRPGRAAPASRRRPTPNGGPAPDGPGPTPARPKPVGADRPSASRARSRPWPSGRPSPPCSPPNGTGCGCPPTGWPGCSSPCCCRPARHSPSPRRPRPSWSTCSCTAR